MVPSSQNSRPYTHTDRRALRTYRPPADVPDNLTGAECRALKELTRNPNIIIKPADKGSKIVTLDRQQYLLEANRQLLNTKYYKPIPDSIQSETQSKLTNLENLIITPQQANYCKTARFSFWPRRPTPLPFLPPTQNPQRPPDMDGSL